MVLIVPVLDHCVHVVWFLLYPFLVIAYKFIFHVIRKLGSTKNYRRGFLCYSILHKGERFIGLGQTKMNFYYAIFKLFRCEDHNKLQDCSA